MTLDVSNYATGDVTVIVATGELDIATAAILREEIHDLLGSGRRHFIVDMRHVTFCDSSGLGVLIGGLKRIRGVGGSLYLTGLTPKVRRPFEISGLKKIFPAYDSVDAALTAMLDV